ncbi:hypothetical protein HYH02_002962 [Chlamydomonas schloesseri]|uniref:Uncharacterized protein n=1 Tax=Chlamydomonas schloesseri TaxID=2026947 RepID=A0A835WSP1_9CHLO|nr:hypothetical protein HYH02_002962 [Chlamydomonas schloesseri]|eukprot:KAG2452732.1 hypothetical protein HYH02_002962 [Chlamydomonas schloesseri]
MAETRPSPRVLVYEDELNDEFTGLADANGLMTIAGFGSLLSERSARYTFPNLVNFRAGQLHGWRRVFAHTADVFFARGIARPDTGEVASLSVERIKAASPSASASASSSATTPTTTATTPTASSEPLVVSLFEVPATADSVAAFIAREHEFRFVAVEPCDLLQGRPLGRRAVVCAANTDADYRAMRCPPQEWERRWGVHGIQAVWGRADVLPCRAYLRHCVLAARSLGPQAERSFLHATYLADRRTTIAEHLARDPSIMDERPPPALAERYNG